jgi:hypothetical protein
MTREELRERFQIYYRRNLPLGIACAIIGLVALISGTVVAARTQKGEFVSLVITSIAWVSGAAFLICIVSLAVIAKPRARVHGLVCSNCGKMLVGKAEPSVVSTGRCCFCGHVLVTDVY